MEKQLVPKLRFPEFKGNWKITELGNISDIYDGTHQTPKYVEKGVPFVSVENINDIENTNKYITPEAFEKKYKIKPQKDDILMTRITAGIIGATSIVNNNNPLAFYVSLALIRIKNSVDVNVKFLEQRINSIYFKHELHKRIIHIAFPKKINLGEIGLCKISFPSPEEQQKIASFLTSVDDRIILLTQQKEKLEQYKKGIMQQLFSQEIRFKDDNGNDFPEWEEKKLGELTNIKKGKQLNKEELTSVGIYPCQNGGIEPSGYTETYNTIENTITISEGGNSCGYVNFLTTKFWCGGHCYSLLNVKKSISNYFLFQYLKFNQNEIMKLRVGSGLPNIQKGDISSFIILLPNIEEQKKIASFLSAIDTQIDQVNGLLEKTNHFKKGLLQQMFV